MTATDTGDTDMIITGKLSTRYIEDHQCASDLPGKVVASGGRGIELEVTIGQLHELASRADYYADPGYGRELRDCGMGELHRSAKKVVEQLKAQTYGQVTLWDLANTPEAKAAHRIEWMDLAR